MSDLDVGEQDIQAQTHHSIASLYDMLARQGSGSHSLLGLTEAQKVWLLSLLVHGSLTKGTKQKGRLVIVHSDPKYVQQIEVLVRCNCNEGDDFLEVQAQNFWGLNRFVNQADIISERLRALTALSTRESGVVFSSFAGIFQKVVSPDVLRKSLLRMEKGQEYDLDKLIEALEERAYRAVDQVEEAGQYTVRGGLLDVFSPALASPVRCEFFGDRLISLKTFAPDTQLSEAECDEVWVVSMWELAFPREERPAATQKLYEALLQQAVPPADRQGIVDAFATFHPIVEMPLLLPTLRPEPVSCLLDYLDEDDTLIFLDSIELCAERYSSYFERLVSESQEDSKALRVSLEPTSHFFPPDHLRQKLSHLALIIECGDLYGKGAGRSHRVQSLAPVSWQGASPLGIEGAGLSFWIQRLRQLDEEGQRIVILVSQSEHLLRLKSLLQHHDLAYKISEKDPVRLVGEAAAKSITIAVGMLPQILWEEREGLLVLPEHILFGEGFQPTRRRKKNPVSVFRSFQELEIGSLVVHVDHGIGRYLGMKTMEMAGIKTDFLVLEYADQDRLYLPVHRLNLLQRYGSSTDTESHPAVDKLRSQGWTKRKAKAKKAIRDMADHLLKIYALRKLANRPPYSAPGDDYFQFEADFAFVETQDQQKAIDEVNSDLSSSQPMDRLVCGDVGFGKTEVALRAAMRILQDGYQVMILAPTTLLSYQHWETFKARFKRFGAEVGLVNRFVKAEDIRRTLAGFQAGQVDILVGTHRLLSKDVVPKRLGLLVVDEEQRFGVGHKEAIKKIKASCDVLTLTATPIPRSLHMALLGIRDISVISTPPTERLAIKTYIAKFDDELIRRAITQEIQRGGQVFFVHNRVHDILSVRARLQEILPDVSIAIAHGQMKDNNVEGVIIDFIQRKYSVLLCTTIIESGIDMPNVNTIIVNEADKFGLSQLYQMRGRVGRSNRQSFAYFLTQGQLADRDDARRRLEILAAHQELGVGFQIASYDMELRGTGNLLGGEQSGQISDIGYELYLDLLDKEVANVRGEEKDLDLDPEIKVPISASLPEAYIPKEKQRLAFYKSLFTASHLDEIQKLASEMRDRFGQIPDLAIALLGIASLKVILRQLKVAQIQRVRPGYFELRFAQLKESEIMKISQACENQKEHLHLTGDFRLIAKVAAKNEASQELEALIERLLPLTLG